jgi:hypothetical protein
MSKCYFELRGNSKQGNINLAADIMRHLHARQYLGKTIIVCEHPAIFLAATHKQWHKLSRTIQKRRGNSFDADRILKYTHAITHMQHMRFTIKSPLDDPEATVYFVRPDQLDAIPTRCFTVYLTATPQKDTAMWLIRQLPIEALLVDYNHTTSWKEFDALPKAMLENVLNDRWKDVESYMSKHHINAKELFDGSLQNIDAMDDALDTLLAHNHSFLQTADSFRRALELARPLRLSKGVREQYDMVTLLAHRVQALSSSSFTQRFLETYSEDDTFFLYDSGRKYLRRDALVGEKLANVITRHMQAGRHHLAQALHQHALAR